MTAINFDSESTVIEMREVQNPYAEFVVPLDYFYTQEGSAKEKVEIGQIDFDNTSVDIYALRIDYFLTEFLRKNYIVDKEFVSKIIFDNKILLGMIEKLVSEVTALHSDQISHMTIRALSNEDDTFEYIFVTFHMDESISIKESIDIEMSFKQGAKGQTYQDGLTFAFV
jgi:hypothetical protein